MHGKMQECDRDMHKQSGRRTQSVGIECRAKMKTEDINALPLLPAALSSLFTTLYLAVKIEESTREWMCNILTCVC